MSPWIFLELFLVYEAHIGGKRKPAGDDSAYCEAGRFNWHILIN